MLGYLSPEGRGAADRIIQDVAARLQARGISLAGAVQINVERPPDRKCDMNLHVLSGTSVIRISQNLGQYARGCRLDPDGLERAAGLVEAALQAGPDMLVINKFGKQELDGRGFRPLIGSAIAAGVPVLTSVNTANLDGFLGFAGGMAEDLPPDPDRIVAWCLEQIPHSGHLTAAQ